MNKEIKRMDEASRVSAGERDRLRKEPPELADRVGGVVTPLDVLPPALRGAR